MGSIQFPRHPNGGLRRASGRPRSLTHADEKLTALQHEFHHSMLSTLHVHPDHDHCLEVIVARGQAAHVKKIADALISMKSVKHGRLTVTTAGADHDG